MDLQIALMLVQDGIVNGAIYALMALALVLVFSVTRVIFIPQGEFVAYAALAMAALQSGKLPPLLWMLLGMAALCLVVEAVRQARGLEVDWKSTLFWAVALPALAALMLLVVAMYFFFERTIVGKALRATAINRVGARLMGIPTALSGDLSFALAALIGAVSGLLIAPVTTIYYDTGFLIGLKGFVAAIVGGLSSYPLALAGALLVGQLESFSSFWASAFKEVIVFTLIIPVLWWRSLNTHHVEDEE